MPKTIAITPSWYWPAGVARVAGTPPFGLDEMLVDRVARTRAVEPVLVSGASRLTGTDLAEAVRTAAGGLESQAGPGALVRLNCSGHVDDVVLLLACVAAGLRVHLTTAGVEPAALGETMVLSAPGWGGIERSSLSGQPGGGRRAGVHESAVALDSVSGALGGEGRPVVAWHSHRSLLSWAISMSTFLGPQRETSFAVDRPISTWDGMLSALTALHGGHTLVLPEPGEPILDAVRREGAGYMLTGFDEAVSLTREAKREAKDLRGSLHAILMPTSGLYDADGRRRVGKLFGTNALTVWGLVETGPVFASHPSWYVDESVGIPITNAHVVPLEPRSGQPLSTLWELVTSARVSVKSPCQMVGYDRSSQAPDPFDPAGRFVTSTIASSDANGMIYILPD